MLGSEIARLLAERRGVLILAGSRRERLDALDAELRTTTAPIGVSCDLRDSRCGAAIADAETPLGRLDGVTNAAGVVALRLGIAICDVHPPHTETELADHSISGMAPKRPVGLSPQAVARVIVESIEAGPSEDPSSAFA